MHRYMAVTMQIVDKLVLISHILNNTKAALGGPIPPWWAPPLDRDSRAASNPH